jgi:hypothetical protein
VSNDERGAVSAFWELWSRNSPPVKQAVLEQAFSLLDVYNEGLGLEVGDREILVTAYGDQSLFVSAENLCRAAPQQLAWGVTCLRAPVPPDELQGLVVNVEGHDFAVEQMSFNPVVSEAAPGSLGLWISMSDAPNLSSDVRRFAARLAVQHVVGERAFASEFFDVDLIEDGDSTPRNTLPLVELADYLTFRRSKIKQ